jgi:hypothetical protein
LGISEHGSIFLRDAAGLNYPSRWLAHGGADVIEVAVVVQHDGAIELGARSGEQIDDASGAMLAFRSHDCLDSARSITNLCRQG